jgi:hypothetical protein
MKLKENVRAISAMYCLSRRELKEKGERAEKKRFLHEQYAWDKVVEKLGEVIEDGKTYIISVANSDNLFPDPELEYGEKRIMIMECKFSFKEMARIENLIVAKYRYKDE